MSADGVLAAKDSALQHAPVAAQAGPQTGEWRRPAPRPLPLFLDMVSRVAQSDPELARRALAGVEVYASAVRLPRPERSVVVQAGRARLLDGGGSGPPVVLVPSLINSSAVLDLDAERSLLDNLCGNGFRAMLIDWGAPAATERDRDIAGHVTHLLALLVDAVGEPVHLVGYCMGGTMAVALATMLQLRSLTLLATPWHFSRYPEPARAALADIWQTHSDTVSTMGLAPIELLQTAFWGLDPDRTVGKFAALAGRAAGDGDVRAFAMLEDWANAGAPLTHAAARDLFTHFIGLDRPGSGQWRVDGRIIDPAKLACPALHFTAADDRIAPSATAPDAIRTIACPSGHVGMIVGGRAEAGCRKPLRDWLTQH